MIVNMIERENISAYLFVCLFVFSSLSFLSQLQRQLLCVSVQNMVNGIIMLNLLNTQSRLLAELHVLDQ